MVRTIYTASDQSYITHDFWKDGREAIDRGREKLVTFGNFPERPIFRTYSGKFVLNVN